MSTDVHTFASSESTIRYREQYVSEGLNRKLAVAMPWGTYRGFKPVAKGSGDRIITIEADATAGDHVAVYLSATGYSLTVRTVGDFDIDLSAYASVTVYVTLYVSYSVGATTAATVRIFTEAEWASAPEKDEVIILGKVDVPASGTIAAADINSNLRRMAWQNKASEAVAWTQILRNGTFEWADTTSTDYWAAAHWRQETTGGTATLGPDDTDPYTGDKHMVLNYSSGTINFQLVQYTQGIPLVPGQRFRIKFFKKMVQAATAGTFEVSVAYTTLTGGTITSGTLATLDTSLDGAYEEFDAIFEVPTGLGIVSLLAPVISGTGLTFGGAGDAIRIDDVQVWVEASAEDLLINAHSMQGEPMYMAMHLFPPGGTFGSLGRYPMLDTDGDVVRIVRSDLQNATAITPPNLELTGALEDLGSRLDNDANQSLTPRIETRVAASGTSTYTLIWQTKSAGSALSRLYSRWDGAIAWTVNAYWTSGGQWDRDDSGQPATMVEQRLDGTFGHYYLDPGSGAPWTTWDLEWESELAQNRINHFDGLTRWLGTTTASNPLFTSTPVANGLYAKNIVKGWWRGNTGASPATSDGFNMDLHSPAYSGSGLWLDFNQAMGDSFYAVASLQINATFGTFSVIDSVSTGSLIVDVWDLASATQINLSSVTKVVTVVVIGEQSS